MAIAVAAEVVRPVALAGERALPVLGPLEPLFPARGLRRGSVVTVGGSTSLALALLAAASGEGSWCAAVGFPSLGLAAAAELGVALDRFPLVPSPRRWAWVVAALADGLDVVLARPPSSVKTADARRLTARVRERGTVLVVAGGWPETAEVRLDVVSSVWEGIGQGHGRLLGRRVEVVAGGRGAAARERRVQLWLPHPDGGVRPAPCNGMPAPCNGMPAPCNGMPAPCNGMPAPCNGTGVADERRPHARRVVS